MLEDRPNRMQNRILENMPDGIPDRISNRMLNRMLENLPNKILDGMNWIPWWGLFNYLLKFKKNYIYNSRLNYGNEKKMLNSGSYWKRLGMEGKNSKKLCLNTD